MEFKPGPIDGVLWTSLEQHADGRGWLCELFRQDEMPAELCPVMAYLSVTEPGRVRGPHEHVEQTDCFCFVGPSSFRVYLWDVRPSSRTCGNCETRVAGANCPMRLIVPPGVIHAYKNIGAVPGLVFNGPNRLYRGPGRQEPVDEIRHEERLGSPYRLLDPASFPLARVQVGG